jgi:hypothetical protein
MLVMVIICAILAQLSLHTAESESILQKVTDGEKHGFVPMGGFGQ